MENERLECLGRSFASALQDLFQYIFQPSSLKLTAKTPLKIRPFAPLQNEKKSILPTNAIFFRCVLKSGRFQGVHFVNSTAVGFGNAGNL